MANYVEIKRLTPKVFKFIDKIGDIQSYYTERWTDIQKIAVIIKQHKKSIFTSSDTLSGDGTEITPVWENIAAIRTFSENTYQPMNNLLTTLYFQLQEKKIDKIPSLEAMIYDVVPEYHGKIHKLSDIYDIIINEEKALYPNQMIFKNVSLVYKFITENASQILEECNYSLTTAKRSLVDLVAKEEELVEENSSLLNNLVNKYYQTSIFSEAEEEDDLEEPPSMDSSTDNVPKHADGEDKKEVITPDEKEIFDEDVLNIILFKLQLTSVLFKSLSTTFEQCLVMLNKIIDLNSILPEEFKEKDDDDDEDEKDDEVKEDEGDFEDKDSEDEPEDGDQSEEVNTDVTEEDDSDSSF